MAIYRTGVITQEQIISICRELFYQKGHRETPFSEICKKANVNPGSISYHFKGKQNIAQIIYCEMNQKCHEQLRVLFPNEDRLHLLLIGLCVHFRLMHMDANYRRFSSQIAVDCASIFLEDGYKFTSPLAYDFLKSLVPAEKYEFFLNASVGIEASVNAYICQHLNPEDFYNNVQYATELYLYLMDGSTLLPMVDDALNATQDLIIKCSDLEITVSRQN